MNINLETHLVNTERLRIKKLTPKFWKIVESLDNLTDLHLVNCDQVDESLVRIQGLKTLKSLRLSGVDLGNKIAELVLPDTLEELQLKRISCDDWTNFIGSKNVTKLVHNGLYLDDLAFILPKLVGLSDVELEAYDDEQLQQLIDIVRECPNLNLLKLRLFELSEKSLMAFFEFAASRSIKLEIECLEDSLDQADAIEIARKFNTDVIFIDD